MQGNQFQVKPFKNKVMKTTKSKNCNKVIVCFHIGRGGRFYNAGYISYVGEMDINTVLEYQSKNVYYYDRDKNGRFCSPYFADLNGKKLISIKEAETGVCTLDWDGIYDTDICCYLDECNEEQLRIIQGSDVYKSVELESELNKLIDHEEI